MITTQPLPLAAWEPVMLLVSFRIPKWNDLIDYYHCSYIHYNHHLSWGCWAGPCDWHVVELFQQWPMKWNAWVETDPYAQWLHTSKCNIYKDYNHLTKIHFEVHQAASTSIKLICMLHVLTGFHRLLPSWSYLIDIIIKLFYCKDLHSDLESSLLLLNCVFALRCSHWHLFDT
jgi:hypothetical protein